MSTDPTPTEHRLTLMTVHAHPDDETIGTGGTMAKAVAEGRRVVLVTGTRGELGEIVVPDMDTPDNHRRLGEIRAGELEAAMGELGVTEWENLGYRDSGMMGDPGNRDPRNYWLADLDSAIGRLVWLVRRIQPDVMTTYNDFGGYGHPDHIRTHLVAVGAFERAGDAKAYPEQLGDGLEPWAPSKLYEQAMSRKLRESMNERMAALGRRSFWLPPEDATPEQLGDGVEPWAPSKLYEQAMSRTLRESMNERMAAMGRRSFWLPPEDATPEQIAEHEAFIAKATVPEESITTRIDIGPYVEAKWAAIQHHVTQISTESPFMQMGLDGWRDAWSTEAYVLRETRIPASAPETDLFAGLTGIS
jgi:LmbE family N-acetylglucosaminyl deacetylase